MSHPREPFERLLDVFDDAFKRIGEREGFVFDPRVGHVSRAIRSKDPTVKRGVFLDFKQHWMKSDPVDPVLVLTYGAWSKAQGGLPVLIKVFYEGRRSDLIGCIDEKLRLAASEVQLLSEETILRYGKTKEDFLREPPAEAQ
ncbi:MAG TPA: hypothetical protein VMU04_18835 [Candidatus Acidoferrum sp.]|nr:hypothetical protein [Candidatus Acidoferrum sp.]